jgi:preprotein translocase subunit SecG
MFTTLVIILHLTVCVALILMILLQTGKGADIGAVFGGGSSHTVFGSTGAASFLSKVTIAAAVTFMVTSIVLSYFSGRGAAVQRSIMEGKPAPVAPARPGPPVPGPVGEKPASHGTAPTVPSTAGKAAAPTSAPVEKPAAPSKAPVQKPAVPQETK